MSVKVEYHFDIVSPNAYLAHAVVPPIERRTGVKFEYVPILLGGVFKASNNVSPVVLMKDVANKIAYTHVEMQRFIAKHGVTQFQYNPHFPLNSLTIMRGAIAAKRVGCFERYVDEVFRHIWAEPKKMDDPGVFQAALEASGLPAAELIALTQDPSVKQELIANTDQFVKRGGFGTPSFFVGDQLFFGKDRLTEVEEEITRQREAAA